MKELIDLCRKLHLTIGTCESCTGGLFASMLSEVSGASAVFVGGVVTYATRIKTEVVHVDEALIQRFGVVSEEVAIDMAQKAQKLLNCDIAVSFTGNAGPGICDDKPVGCIYAAVMIQDICYSFPLQLSGERNEIRKEACVILSEKIIDILSERLMTCI